MQARWVGSINWHSSLCCLRWWSMILIVQGLPGKAFLHFARTCVKDTKITCAELPDHQSQLTQAFIHPLVVVVYPSPMDPPVIFRLLNHHASCFGTVIAQILNNQYRKIINNVTELNSLLSLRFEVMNSSWNIELIEMHNRLNGYQWKGLLHLSHHWICGCVLIGKMFSVDLSIVG